LVLGVRYAQNSGETFFFIGIYAIIPPTRQFGYKKMNLLAVKLGKRGSKNYFWAVGVKVAAQSRLEYEEAIMSVDGKSRDLSPQVVLIHRGVIIKLLDGSRVKGKINMFSDGAVVDRVSDMFTKVANPFIVVYDAMVEGETGKVFILNKRNILWVLPEDTPQPA